MRGEPGRLVLGERKPIARQRIDRVKRGSPDDAVIAVSEVGRVGLFGVVGKEDRRAPTTHCGHEVAAQGDGILDAPVGVAQNDYLSDAEDARRLARLSFPLRSDNFPRRRPVAAPALACGHQQEADLRTLVAEQGEGAGAPAINIIGMSGNRKHALFRR